MWSNRVSRQRGAIFVESDRPRFPRVRPGRVLRPRGCSRACTTNAAARRNLTHDRCNLPAGDQGPQRGPSSYAADDYTIVMIGHEGHEEVEGHDGRGARTRSCSIDDRAAEDVENADRGPIPNKVAWSSPRRPCRSMRPSRGDRRACAQSFPAIVGPASTDRHLLRDHQPPGRRQAAGDRVRPGPGDRLDATPRTPTAWSRSCGSSEPTRT